MATPASNTRTRLPIVRLAMTSMVAVAGVGSAFLLRYGTITPNFPSDHPMLLGYFVVMLFVVGWVVQLFKRKRAQTDADARFVRYTLVSWSAGEGMAILGAVFYLFTGNAAFYVADVISLVIAFFLVPAYTRN